MKDFETALNTFLEKTQASLDKHTEENFPSLKSPKLVAEVGRKFVKIVKEDRDTPNRSAFCFIVREAGTTAALGSVSVGDVLKSASWKAPARGKRGTIFTEDPSEYGVGVYGANYLR